MVTFLEYLERRRNIFFGQLIGFVVACGIIEFFGISNIPVTGLTVFEVAVGIFFLAPVLEYFWSKVK